MMRFETFLEQAAPHAASGVAAQFYSEAQKHPAGSKPHHEAMANHHYHASQSAHKAGDHVIAKYHAQQHAEHAKKV